MKSQRSFPWERRICGLNSQSSRLKTGISRTDFGKTSDYQRSTISQCKAPFASCVPFPRHVRMLNLHNFCFAAEGDGKIRLAKYPFCSNWTWRFLLCINIFRVLPTIIEANILLLYQRDKLSLEEFWNASQCGVVESRDGKPWGVNHPESAYKHHTSPCLPEVVWHRPLGTISTLSICSRTYIYSAVFPPPAIQDDNLSIMNEFQYNWSSKHPLRLTWLLLLLEDAAVPTASLGFLGSSFQRS